MAKVAQQMVEQSGINVNELLDKLVRAASAEFTTTTTRFCGSTPLAWRVRDSKKSLRIRLEDRNHFEALIPRIYELGGEIPRDIRDFANMAACPDAYLPERGQGCDSTSPRVGFTSGGTEEAKEAVSEVKCSKVTYDRCYRFWSKPSCCAIRSIPTSAI